VLSPHLWRPRDGVCEACGPPRSDIGSRAKTCQSACSGARFSACRSPCARVVQIGRSSGGKQRRCFEGLVERPGAGRRDASGDDRRRASGGLCRGLGGARQACDGGRTAGVSPVSVRAGRSRGTLRGAPRRPGRAGAGRSGERTRDPGVGARQGARDAARFRSTAGVSATRRQRRWVGAFLSGRRAVARAVSSPARSRRARV